MAECPDCGKYVQGRKCSCGWAGRSISPFLGVSGDPDKCATCAGIHEKRKEYRAHDTSVPTHHCYACGTHDSSVTTFPEDSPCTSDRGMRLCSSCYMPALVRRSTCTHEWARGRRNGEHCERCEREITGQRELFREYMRQIAARMGAV